MGYLSLTDADRAEMLAAIGVSSIDELFEQIPPGVRFDRELDVPAALTEVELVAHLSELAARNVHTGAELSFLGAGIYDHYVPSVVDVLLSRGEFLTAYTPYQPEMSQGVLQAIFEYQTVICELTGMDVSNASGYDGTHGRGGCLLRREAHERSLEDRARRDAEPAGAPGGQDVRPRVRARRRRGAAPRRDDRSGGARPRGRGRGRGDLPAAELPRLPRAGAGPRRGGERRRRARGRARRPDVARCARGARRVRLRDGDRRRAERGLPAALRRSALRVPRRTSGLRAPDAGPHRRRDARRRRATCVRSHAADARAAHPSREGDLEHHDEPDAARARGAGDALVARAGGPARGGGDVRSRWPQYARERGSRSSRRSTRRRSRRSRSGLRSRRARSSGARASAVCIPATSSAATTRAWTTSCSSRSPRSGRPRTSIASRTSSPRSADERGGSGLARRAAHLRALAAGTPCRTGSRATACRVPSFPTSSAARRAATAPRARRARARAPLHARSPTARSASTPASTRSARCTMKHNPRVNERVGAAARVPRSPPAPGGRRRAGRARAHVAAAGDPRRGRRASGRDAAARRWLAGRADGPHAHARVLRRPRGGARHDRHRRHRARHEPRERDDGGLQAREGRDGRARQPRPRRPAREGERADGRPHAHEPVDARALRRGHRGGRARSSTTRARSSTTTART